MLLEFPFLMKRRKENQIFHNAKFILIFRIHTLAVGCFTHSMIMVFNLVIPMSPIQTNDRNYQVSSTGLLSKTPFSSYSDIVSSWVNVVNSLIHFALFTAVLERM